ncbi:MAG TPA: DNA/RNA non-specific endonuclease [Pseudonocardia sp.]|nr:DNA/RNA non-specific endonuclease [Pseudonocardia sp.]
MDAQDVTITVPLTITVRLGDATGTPASAPAVALDRAAAAVHPISYYDGYLGYDPTFLQVPVRLPSLTDEQRRNAATSTTAGPNDDPTVLPYTHFSLVMNRARQLAYYTAVNIDGSTSNDLKRTADHWFYDGRIAESEQIGEELYQRNALDRGHLVRRLDPVWGPDFERANEDTFHFTNCSPQHERFNQGKDLWAGLENYILENAEALDRKITVFTGPVTEDTDPIYKGVRLPLAFWKIIAYCRSDGTLATAAYVLEQGALIQEILSRAVTFDPGTYRLSIADLDARTGLDFAYLADHELPLSSGGIERAVGHVRIAENYTNLAL